ncbi:MAG: winged helix-turn-helix transcriptional regulator [Saprospiraceae bacterium]|nr:winged helix-turn-helix transcriptional regulator [Saprospiraceae bacterium]
MDIIHYELINETELRIAVLVLRALNHKLRMKMLKFIQVQGKKVTVIDVYVQLKLEQAKASQHLAILRRANILVSEREGKNIYYSINFEMVQHIKHAVDIIYNAKKDKEKNIN